MATMVAKMLNTVTMVDTVREEEATLVEVIAGEEEEGVIVEAEETAVGEAEETAGGEGRRRHPRDESCYGSALPAVQVHGVAPTRPCDL